MIEWHINKSTRGGSNKGYYMTIAVSKCRTTKEGVVKHSLCIRVSPDAAKDLRLIEGDRLMVGLDRISKQVCFKRTAIPREGIKLCKSGTGKSTSMKIQIEIDIPWMQTVEVEKSAVHSESTHVALDCPTLFGARP